MSHTIQIITDTKILTSLDCLQELCKYKGCWGMLLCFPDISIGEYRHTYFGEVQKAVPYISMQDLFGMGGNTMFLFGPCKEIESRFWQTVGEDGPTPENTYDGPARVYAITCDQNGHLQHENA